jgi:tetratricopeptide (TPR) repeat protein
MINEAIASMSCVRLLYGACPPSRAEGREDRGRNGAGMKPNRRTTSVSDRRVSLLLRLGVLVLVVGVAAFGTIYYQDQHLSAGPSMIDRQTQNAEAAVKKTPNDINARLTLAADYQEAKRLDDALAQYNIILNAAKGNRFALLGRGSVQTAKGNLTAAVADYKQITAANAKGQFAGADPQLQEAYYHLGSIAVTQGKAKEAIFELQAAIGIDPQDSDSLYLMGLAQLKAGAPKLAIDAFTKAVEFVPTGWCEPYTQLALTYGKLADAPQATYNAGMADFCHNEIADAKAKLTTLIKGPQEVNAMLGLAVIADTGSDHAGAIGWFKKVLVVDPKNVAAIAALKQLAAVPTPSNTSPAPKAAGSSTTQGPS